MRATPQINVGLDIDANGTLRAGVKDPAPAKEKKITIKVNSRLANLEIQHMVQVGQTIRWQSTRLHALAECRNKSDALTRDVRKATAALGDMVEAATVICFEADFSHLSKAIKGNSAMTIQA